VGHLNKYNIVILTSNFMLTTKLDDIIE